MTGFARPDALLWLWALAPVGGLLAFAFWRRRRGLRRFAEAGLAERLAPGFGGARAAVKAVLLLAALASAVVALAGPRGEPVPAEVQRLGRDVCFIVDVSRSMLAEDLKPNRLERAKLWLADVVNSLDGDRVGVVAMAGRPEVAAPLTHDYAFVQTVIAGLDPDLAMKGGTNIGDAVRSAVREVFAIPAPGVGEDGEEGAADVDARFRDIILITDGEDTMDSLPVAAARTAAEAGVRLIIIGIGGGDGSRIPMYDDEGRRVGFVRDRAGRDVVARLDRDTLREMADAAEGNVFLDAGLSEVPLDRIYAELMDDAERRRLAEAEGVTFDEWFQGFALAALLLLIVETLIAERSRR